MKARIPLKPENDRFDCRIQRLNEDITVYHLKVFSYHPRV